MPVYNPAVEGLPTIVLASLQWQQKFKDILSIAVRRKLIKRQNQTENKMLMYD